MARFVLPKETVSLFDKQVVLMKSLPQQDGVKNRGKNTNHQDIADSLSEMILKNMKRFNYSVNSVEYIPESIRFRNLKTEFEITFYVRNRANGKGVYSMEFDSKDRKQTTFVYSNEISALAFIAIIKWPKSIILTFRSTMPGIPSRLASENSEITKHFKAIGINFQLNKK